MLWKWIRKLLRRRARVRAILPHIDDPVTERVVRLWLGSRKSLRAIAEELGLEVSEVGWRLHKAMSKLDPEGWPSLACSRPPYSFGTFDSADEERLEATAESFWDLLDRGKDPDPAEFLAQVPDLADQLRGRIWLIQLMHQNRHRERRGPCSGHVVEVDGPEMECLFHRILATGHDRVERILQRMEEEIGRPRSVSKAEARALIWARYRQLSRRWESDREWWHEKEEEGPGPIQRALDSHPGRVDAEILQQHLSDGQSLDQIAIRLGMDPGEVRFRYRRARHWLQLELEEVL